MGRILPDSADAGAGRESRLLAGNAEILIRAGLDPSAVEEKGLFAPNGWLRRISGEQAVLLGGGRALLLELAHPLVAAGVAAHSNFEKDPFGRLQRTLDAVSTITFGSRDAALAAVRGVERAHARVSGVLEVAVGPFPAGTVYDGRAPELMAWIWATLVDTALVVYERFVAPVEEAARCAYYLEHRVVARLLGIPDDLVPATWSDFRSWFETMLESDTLTVSEAAVRVARSVVSPPVRSPMTGTVRILTAALLPERLRDAFDLPMSARHRERFHELTEHVRSLRGLRDA